MLLLSHTVTGAVIGQKLNDPIIISLLAFASHYILDCLPHWNYLDGLGRRKYDEHERFNSWLYLKALPDIITSVLIYLAFLFSFPDQWLTISLGVCFAILPDFFTLSKYIPGVKLIFRPLNKFHHKIQGHINEKYNKMVAGLLIQIIYLSLLITIFIII